MGTIPDIIESNSIKDLKKAPLQNYEKMPERTVTKTKEESEKGWLLDLLIPDYPNLESYIKAKFREAIKTVVGPKLRDIVINSIETVLGKTPSASSSTQRTGTINRVSYDYSNIGPNTQKPSSQFKVASSARNSIYEDISFDTNEEATEFMRIVREVFDDQGGYISILMFYNIARRATSSVQQNYGWLSLSSMRCEYMNNRYFIRMPDPVAINQ